MEWMKQIMEWMSKRHGYEEVSYYDNGQLNFKGDFKNGKMEGYWVLYDEEGTIRKGLTGMWKDGEPISD